MSEEVVTSSDERATSLADEVEQLRQEATASFARGYEEGVVEGRRRQQEEDRYYIDRAERLSGLLAQAEAEIQRLRNRE